MQPKPRGESADELLGNTPVGVSSPSSSPAMWTQSCPFSIVVCTYNGEQFIDEQLRSLRQQEGVREIVVSDDGSTDRTLAILAAHAAEDSRVQVHCNSARRGVTANFQHVIGLATSPWIALADQDDIWLPG